MNIAERYLVFSTETGGGNPAGVAWLRDDEEDAEELQRAATAAQLPVCAFIRGDATPRVRFFTRAVELPSCGHGALAAGAALMARHGTDQATFVSGNQTVSVELRSGLYVLTSTQAWVRDELPAEAQVLDALGVRRNQLRSIRTASIGSPKAILELCDEGALRSLAPDYPALAGWSRSHQINGAYVYTLGPEGRPRARAFNPAGGNDEDAATGVAAGALVWALDHPRGQWLPVLQVPAGTSPCELHARRLDQQRTEVGGRVSRLAEEN